MDLFGQTTLPALGRTLAFTEKRHEVLAGNLANLDTPGYRVRDLDVDGFQQTLADSIRRGEPAATMTGEPRTRDDARLGPRSTDEAIIYHDGSDVSMERQVTEVAKNQHLHSLAVTTMRSQFELLRSAITERA